MFDYRLFRETPTGRDLYEIFGKEALEEGIQKGEVLALQRSLVNIVRVRYPELAALAQQQADHIDKTETLDLLIEQVVAASSARAVRKLLQSGPKS